jgi:uncharacterized protein YbjT (DUF2867 family)
MKVILFGGTGMVGQGVLRECLLDRDVTNILSVVRAPSGQTHPKLRELVHDNFVDFTSVATDLFAYDACFYCLGATSIGKTEAEYSRVTYDITVAAADVVAHASPRSTFIFVSGANSDGSEKGPVMWARIKGKAENAVLAMPFHAVYVFRPALIQPMHGIKSKTALYRIPYLLLAPIVPWLKRQLPKYVTTTETIGRAMLNVTRRGYPVRILETSDINAAAPEPPSSRGEEWRG